MDPLRIKALAQGYFTRSDAHAAGLDDNAIRRALKSRTWLRIRQGVYTLPDIWAGLDDAARHLATARAVARKLGDTVALSHTSAVLDHGLDVWGADLSVVHLTRLDGGAGRTEAGVQHHEGFCLESDVLERDGYLVMAPARAALEAGSLLNSEQTVVLLDAGLHHELFTTTELDAGLELVRYWPGTLHLQFAVPFADGRAESQGESRSRYLCYAHGLPAPELQFYVYDARGRLIGITDFAWPEHRLLGEFDGKVKYVRFLRPGETPSDVVFREKKREDLLRRATGWPVVRLTWADLYQGAQTAAEIRALMRPAA